jgi:hypothetical protein
MSQNNQSILPKTNDLTARFAESLSIGKSGVHVTFQPAKVGRQTKYSFTWSTYHGDLRRSFILLAFQLEQIWYVIFLVAYLTLLAEV